MTLFDKIKKLTEIQASSGFEGPVRDYLKQEMTAMGYQPEFDGLGGIFVTKTSQVADAPVVMIAAHMDEVSFMVSSIKADGTFRVVPLGGWNPLVVSGQRFSLFSSQAGKKIPVVTGGLPPHLLRGSNATPGMPEIGQIVFDAGFEDADEAAAYGVAIGDLIIPETETILTANGKNVISKAWDNRYGCLMVLELLDYLKDKELPVTLVIGANVQEEVGLRGAKVATTKFKPELFFAVDCSPASDTFGDDNGRLGAGVTMRYFDPGHIMLPGMKAFLTDTATEANVKTQPYMAKGGTDAGAAHLSNEGVPSTTIGVCARYIHSHQTISSLSDFDEAQKMIRAIVEKLDRAKVDKIKNY
ncbi:glutamyl aminopeptidase [Lactococcus termiticola]|uniref:Glutamyl aminopeptidase n=1 Tax=Lactococcus termiticola TaxID=2169526 RepID=A0A2R5HIC0_9LACT|nr:glutamyl aminopeptidase [Lactococcus termiticola]GBG96040.1 glutamyl aminopeptidase [Lactococcus termiticola]